MKKLLPIIILAMLVFSVIACEKVVPKQLSAPQVERFDDRLEWAMDINATGYQIVTNQTITTTNTVFYFGDYKGTIKIKCLGDGKLYKNSDYTIVEIY